jgi:hypothetical protein
MLRYYRHMLLICVLIGLVYSAVTLTPVMAQGTSYTSTHDKSPSEANTVSTTGTIAHAQVSAEPELTLQDVTVVEGNSGTINFAITITTTAPLPLGTEIDINVTGGTATNSTDYTSALPGKLVVLIGGVTTLNYVGIIAIQGDTVFEPDETIELTISGQPNIVDAVGIVTIRNDDPAPLTAVTDSYTTPENTALNISAPGVLGNDTGGTGTYSVVGNSNPANGSVALNADGSFVYTPNTDYVGSDSFSYTLSDGSNTTSGTVIVQVTDPNAPPNNVPPASATPEPFRGPALPEPSARNLYLLGEDTPLLSSPNGETTSKVLLACQTVFILETSGQFGRVYSFGNSRGWISTNTLIDVAEDYGQPDGQPILPQCVGR